MIRGKGKAFRDTNIKFTADVRIPWDITLFFSLDRYLNIAYGLTVPIQFRSIYGPGVDLRYNRTANQDAAPDINGFTVAVRLARSRSGLTMPGPKNFVKITFDGTMHEIEKKSFWGTNSTVFYDLVKGIRSISEDTGIDGLIIHIGKPGIGFARI